MTARLVRPAIRATALLIGLSGYGFSMAMMVQAGLGLDPWDVFHQGLSHHTGLSIGTVSAVVGVAVLLAWIPLRNRPGIGTIANVIVIAVTVDLGLLLLPVPTALPVRIAMMVGAVLLNAVSTVLYVGAGLGPGPRDGLMTGLVERTGRSVRLVRTAIEATVLVAGWLLGGTVGVGTVVYAFGIGPLCQLLLRMTPRRVLAASGWASIVEARDTRNRKDDPQAGQTAGYGTMVECATGATSTSTPPSTPTSTPTGKPPTPTC